jgi:hypothetical protein
MGVHAGALVFISAFVGAFLGVFVGRRLPARHLAPETKDVVRLGMGMVATITALVLGLLVQSAKTFYDGQSAELAQMSANIVMLDRFLRHYGPEADEARLVLRRGVAGALDALWPNEPTKLNMSPLSASSDRLYDYIEELRPKDDRQRSIQAHASSIAVSLGQTRWLIFEQTIKSSSRPLLVVLLLWVTSIFFSWGMYAPFNTTTVIVFLISALSVAASVVLIQDWSSPYSGLLRISPAPLRAAQMELQK